MPVFLAQHKGRPGDLVCTRQQWSKYLCGMLNSGHGGVLYGGILDNGEVQGFMLSPYQRLHVVLQLQEVLDRFLPPVPPSLVSLQFVRIQEPGLNEDEMKEAPVRPEMWRLEHKMRDWARCWCDQEACAAAMYGLLLPWWVIEVTVGEQRRERFAAEDGQVYLRGHGSTELVGLRCGRCGEDRHVARDCTGASVDKVI